MKGDPKSNYYILNLLAPDEYAPGEYFTKKLDFGLGPAASTMAAIGSMTAGSVVKAFVQYSNDNIIWTDASADPADSKNEVGEIIIHITNTSAGRYYRLKITVENAAAVISVAGFLGPKRSV